MFLTDRKAPLFDNITFLIKQKHINSPFLKVHLMNCNGFCITRENYVCQRKHVFNHNQQIMWQLNPYLHNPANYQITYILQTINIVSDNKDLIK